MKSYTKNEVLLTIKSLLAPLSANVQTLDHGNQLTIHVDDKYGHRILNVTGLVTPGLLMQRLQTLDGMQTLITFVTENLKRRGYLE